MCFRRKCKKRGGKKNYIKKKKQTFKVLFKWIQGTSDCDTNVFFDRINICGIYL